MIRWMLLGICMVAAVACGDPPLSPDASGDEIYRARCARCHGEDLEGGGGLFNSRGPALGPGSAAVERSDSYYLQTITRGQGRMPAVRGLTSDQIDRVIAHLRSVQEGG